MTHTTLVEECWDAGTPLPDDALEAIIDRLDRGEERAALLDGDRWVVNSWVKKAILMYFRQTGCSVDISGARPSYDKVPIKCAGWNKAHFEHAGFRLVPGAIIRRGAFIAPGCVIMPSFINIGAFVDTATMIDNMAYVGSCAQVGKNCHISGAAGLGGVLEPLQAAPVIVEDDCFIGAGVQIAEGVRIGRGSVIALGTHISASTKIIERTTGAIHQGYVPPYSVVVPGAYTDPRHPQLSIQCAMIIKTVDAGVRAKTQPNDLLRGLDGHA